MATVTVLAAILVFASANLAAAPPAGSALGIVIANGDFRLNDVTVNGNATLTEGAIVETSAVPSRLQLNNGPRIELSTKTRVEVHQDRLILESGMGDLSSPGTYQVEAGAFRIAPATPDSAARVARPAEKVVQVAALKGSVKVYSAKGLLLANVVPGSALAFEAQQAGTAPPSSFLGCLLKKQGKFILYDQTTRIIVELRGTGFEKEWGNRVQIIGTTDTTAQSTVGAQVVDVTTMTRFGLGGCSPVASAIAAELPPAAPPAAPAAPAPTQPAKGAPQPAPKGGGMSAGAKVAIIAAVGGGGAAGAILATKSKESRSPD